VVLGFWGDDAPFRGREVEDLIASGNWLAAVLVFIGALYLVGRFGNRLGWQQLGHMALLSGAAILALITARTAYMASYINYDYATEYLVYAHAGPRVKTVMEEIDHIATITNEDTAMRVVFDDESSWPYTWYFRDYTNYGYLRGEAGNVDPTSLDGARVVVVGNKKAGDVRRLLGDRYYEFQYIRLWWPMQEYFNLNYDRVSNVFGTDLDSQYYRDGLFDIWWDRDYSTYAQAMCIDTNLYRCDQEAQWGQTPEEQDQFRKSCELAVVSECQGDTRFAVDQWPVSDRMYFFVDKQLAAQVWDAGIGSSTVDIREPAYPEDDVYQDITAELIIGETSAMNAPRDVAVGPDGNLYVADAGRSRILVLSPTGDVVRTLGEAAEPNGLPVLSQAWGVDVAPDGAVYVADTWNHRVVVFSPEGEVSNTWGHYGVVPDDTSTDAFWGPRDIAISPAGLVYVADTGGKRVRAYTMDGEWVRDLGGSGTALGQMDEPVGLAFNPVSGNLYVAEAWNQRIQEFDPNGFTVRVFEVNMWFQNRQSPNRPYIAVSPDGTLIYVTDMDDRQRIVAYNLAGQPVYSFDQPDDLETGLLGLRNPAGMTFGADGRFYVVDADQAQVYVFPSPEVTGNVPPAVQIMPLAEDSEPDSDLDTDLDDEVSDDQDAASVDESGDAAGDDPADPNLDNNDGAGNDANVDDLSPTPDQ
ncbi:MAG: hypothetical protein JXA10_17570, partial [Anaerolineae bacterium]|nr:hypothetical protein [Anaerolineae bacterium]